MYEIFNMRSANMVDCFDTRDEALRFVREVLDEGCVEDVKGWSLGSLDEPGHAISGDALVECARAGRKPKRILLVHDTFAISESWKAFPNVEKAIADDNSLYEGDYISGWERDDVLKQAIELPDYVVSARYEWEVVEVE